jgi:ABC-type branched-subunit amino acid transport system substrate-binding protein
VVVGGAFFAPINAGSVDLAPAAHDLLSLTPAQIRYESGDREGALSELRRYILTYPDSPNLAAAHVLMARILLDEQRAADALFYLQRIPLSQQNDLSALLQVVAMQTQGQFALAQKILTTLRVELFAADDQQLFYRCQAQDFIAHGQPLQALVILRAVLKQRPYADQGVTFGQIKAVFNNLSAEEAAEVDFMFVDTELADALILHRAEQALAAGDKDQARQLGEDLVALAHTAWAREQAAVLLDSVYGQRWQRRAIGVVLPLTGRYAPFGQLVRQGIEFAAQRSNAQQSFIFIDSKADPQQGALAVKTLIDGYRVMAIIGPLTGDVAEAVVAQVNAAQVPMLTLSHRTGLPARGEYIFRNCLTVEQQVEALAEYAINSLGLNAYSILYPDNSAGSEFAAKFRAAIERRGGDIVYQLSCDDQGTDFRRQLLLLKGENPDAAPIDDDASAPEDELEGLFADLPLSAEELAERLAAQRAAELAAERAKWLPTVDFEALFVPAYADSIALLAPQLAFYGIENIQLLGINGWNSAKLLQQAGRYTKGAVFSDGFFVDSTEPVVADFVAGYLHQFGDKPSILEAQAYDCVNILLPIITNPLVSSSMAVQRELVAVKNYPGVTGVSGFAANGEALREVLLLRMERRSLSQIPQQQATPVEMTPRYW